MGDAQGEGQGRTHARAQAQARAHAHTLHADASFGVVTGRLPPAACPSPGTHAHTRRTHARPWAHTPARTHVCGRTCKAAATDFSNEFRCVRVLPLVVVVVVVGHTQVGLNLYESEGTDWVLDVLHDGRPAPEQAAATADGSKGAAPPSCSSSSSAPLTSQQPGQGQGQQPSRDRRGAGAQQGGGQQQQQQPWLLQQRGVRRVGGEGDAEAQVGGGGCCLPACLPAWSIH